MLDKLTWMWYTVLRDGDRGDDLRNEYKKITFEDKFARKFYSDKSSRAIKKQENKRNKKIMRRYNKKLINKELKKLDKDMY